LEPNDLRLAGVRRDGASTGRQAAAVSTRRVRARMAMSEASVAGVAVDTRHWIGGRRVASPATWSFDFYADVKNTVYAGRGWRANG
jgi:hypothetical protein